MEDHLGSSNLQLDADGVLVSREEYYPFGETSFGSYGCKRYRFCGKEKDDESGLYYYGFRYYNPWTCRFINIDPLAPKYAQLTPYQYAGNKPINHFDIDGAESTGDKPVDNGATKNANGTITNNGVYTIAGGGGKKGFDTLHSIAKRFGVTVKELMEINNLSDTKIKARDTLKIPGRYQGQDSQSNPSWIMTFKGENVLSPSFGEKPKELKDSIVYQQSFWGPGGGPIGYFFPELKESVNFDQQGPVKSASIIVEAKAKAGPVSVNIQQEWAETGDGVITRRDPKVDAVKFSTKQLMKSMDNGDKLKNPNKVEMPKTEIVLSAYMQFMLEGKWLKDGSIKGEIGWGPLKAKLDSSGKLKLGLDWSIGGENKLDPSKGFDVEPTMYKF